MQISSHAHPRPPVLDDDGMLVVDLAAHEQAAEVRLLQEVRRPRDEPVFRRIDRGWRALLDPGPVDRLEYRFSVRSHDGGTAILTDPHNPAVVADPFGARSVWTRSTYVPPAWTTSMPRRRGHRTQTTLRSAVLGMDLPTRIWHHPDLAPGSPGPLLVVHDGPAYDDEAGLGLLLDHLSSDPSVPPARAALLAAPDRDRLYSANPRYARAVLDDVVAGVAAHTGGEVTTLVGLGASLGGLAHLHAAVEHPGAYGAMLLQSGSYFRPTLDGVESGWPWFGRVTGFTDRLQTEAPGPAVPTIMTCGLVEENLSNNEEVAERLRDCGWPVELVGVRDAHNMTAWRDALHPHLRDALRTVA